MNNKQLEEDKAINEIDLIILFRKLFHFRKKLLKIIGLGGLIGLIIGISLPKTYKVEVILSPESGVNVTNELSGIASMFGLGNSATVWRRYFKFQHVSWNRKNEPIYIRDAPNSHQDTK